MHFGIPSLHVYFLLEGIKDLGVILVEVILFCFSLPFLEQNSAHSQVVFLFG
jgi:hypothetical protein